MSRTIALSKFIGTISLGLFTGTSYTLSTSTLPALLALPTAPTCATALTHLSRFATAHRNLLAGISTSAFVFAYAISPRSAKHPYLLWTGLVTVLAHAGPELAMRVKGERVEEGDDGVKVGRQGGEEEVNGESVRRDVVSWRRREAVRAGLAGTAFTMAVVGIWGDGF